MEKKGFEVESYSDYASSVKRVKEKKFNFAIVDMRLGDGSGLELIKLINSISPETRSFYLLVMGT